MREILLKEGLDKVFSFLCYAQPATAMPRILSLFFLALLVSLPAAQAQGPDNDFDCDSHTLFVYRLSAIPSEAPLPDGANTRVLAAQEFSGFAKYNIDSVQVTVRFDPKPDSSGAPPSSGPPSGGIRVGTAIRSGGKSSEAEIHYSPRRSTGMGWSAEDDLSILLQVRLFPGDPALDDQGNPVIRISQAEAGVPIFLIRFIGVVSAGGWGLVDSDNAMALDLRGGALSMPAALGCIKNDFAGQQHEDDWARCLWDHAKQDYDCTTSEGEFFLISGKKIERRRAKRRK